MAQVKKPRKAAAKKDTKATPEYDLSWMLTPDDAGVSDVFEMFSKVNKYDRGDSEFSVTQLINSPQQIALEKQNEAELKESGQAENVYAILGKAVHRILEDANPSDSLLEERFFLMVDGVKVSGSMDRIKKLPSGGYALTDYKVMSFWSVKDGVKLSHEWQLNMYAYIIEKLYKVKIEKLIIVAIFRDWSEGRKQPYAPSPIVYMNVPLWTFAAREAFVRRRVAMHRAAQVDIQHGKIPTRCTAEEVWDTDRAKTWFLENSGKQYYMDAPRKCALYCPVSKYCAQFLEYKVGTTFESEILGVKASDNPGEGEA